MAHQAAVAVGITGARRLGSVRTWGEMRDPGPTERRQSAGEGASARCSPQVQLIALSGTVVPDAHDGTPVARRIKASNQRLGKTSCRKIMGLAPYPTA